LSHYVYHDSKGANDHQEVDEERSQLLEYSRKHFNEETQFCNDPDQLTEFEEAADCDCHLESLNCLQLGRINEREHEIGKVEEEEKLVIIVPEVL